MWIVLTLQLPSLCVCEWRLFSEYNYQVWYFLQLSNSLKTLFQIMRKGETFLKALVTAYFNMFLKSLAP